METGHYSAQLVKMEPYASWLSEARAVDRMSRYNLRRRRIPRLIRERIDVALLSDRELLRLTRLNRAAFDELYARLETYLRPLTSRSHAVSGQTKLFACLQFLANGSFQRLGGFACGVSQSTMSRIISQFLIGMRRISRELIHFPRSPAEWDAVKVAFYHLAQMPNVIGAIDCTHVALVPPSADEYMYRNRKLGHSLNVQVVCGPDMEIFSVVAKFPGSCHDAHILRESALFNFFHAFYREGGWLLGDAGYPCLPWLLTPLGHPSNNAEEAYNRAHVRTRSVIERCFGHLKTRFRCIDNSGGALLYKPQKVIDIIVACCVVHNICIKQNLPGYRLPHTPLSVQSDDFEDEEPDEEEEPDEAGNVVRGRVIVEFFE
ncbi:putative nuclease HARBI1 [Hyperolius riggenbachi]|uniref:putative nuclease HARBI1 n=1 Tax=Hyperolius riggenbachi TaxID=752182 RepID=UPI0035A32FC6